MKSLEKANIFVDSSYAVYYTVYSSWSYYRSAYNVVDVPENFEPMNDVRFKNLFEKRFIQFLETTIRKSTRLFSYKDIYFAMDCGKNYIWRNDYFHDYKLTRKQKKEPREFSLHGTFNHFVDVMLPTLVEERGCKVLRNSAAEGDDIIYGLVKHFKGQRNIVISSDKDLLQLTRFKGTQIVNLKGQRLEIKDGLSPREFLLQRIISGDSSDEIPGILPRVGPKKSYALVKNRENLQKILNNDTKANRYFVRNKKLMDLSLIPSSILEEISNDIVNSVL